MSDNAFIGHIADFFPPKNFGLFDDRILNGKRIKSCPELIWYLRKLLFNHVLLILVHDAALHS